MGLGEERCLVRVLLKYQPVLSAGGAHSVMNRCGGRFIHQDIKILACYNSGLTVNHIAKEVQYTVVISTLHRVMGGLSFS